MMIRDALQTVLDDYTVNEKRSISDAALRVRHLLRFFASECELDSITTRDLLAYAAARRRQGATPASVNREVSILRRGYYLAGVPWRRPPERDWKMLRESAPRQGFFEKEQLDAVLACLPLAERHAVQFAYLTGWRIKSEVLPLCWDHVDFERGEVRLLEGKTKSGEGRVFPLFPQLRALLEARWDVRQGEYVFHRNGRPIRWFYDTWRKACQTAGVVGRLLHDLRRTAARNLRDAGVDEQTAMKLLGHKTPSIFRRYRILDRRDLDRAAAVLSKHLDEKARKDS